MHFYLRFLKGVLFLGGFAGAVLGVGTDTVFSDDDVLSVGSNNERSDDEFDEVPAGYLEEPFAGVVYAQIEEVRNLLQGALAPRDHLMTQVSGSSWDQYSLAAIWELMVELTNDSRYSWGSNVLVDRDYFQQLYITSSDRVELSAAPDFLEGHNTAARHAVALLDNLLIEIASVIGELNRVREIVHQGGVLNVEELQRQLVLLTRYLIRGAWYTYYAARSDTLWGELSPRLIEQIECIGELMWARAGALDRFIYQVAEGWTISLFNQHFFPRVPSPYVPNREIRNITIVGTVPAAHDVRGGWAGWIDR